MAETNILSVLPVSPHVSLNPQTRKSSHAQSHRPRFRDAPIASEGNGVIKKKQSKSRDGCVTCKTKRLKCDEAKPSCKQCKRRNVSCEGYKRDFKWRPFEEPSCIGKRRNKARKDSSSSTALSTQPCSSYKETLCDRYHGYADTNTNVHYTPPYSATFDPYDQLSATTISHAPVAPVGGMYTTPTLSPYLVTSQSISPVDAVTPFFQESRSLYEDDSMPTEQSEATAPSSVTVGYSPRLLDLPSTGTYQCAPLEEHLSYRNWVEAIYQPTDCAPLHEPGENDNKKVPRNSYYIQGSWLLRYLSPTALGRASFFTGFQDHSTLAQPQQAITSADTISKSFHYNRCGVSSVEDGLPENPWRALIWPLARECSALYHAIAFMTYFHQSSQSSHVRTQGINHLRTAIKALKEGTHGMRLDAAVATKLVLAFAESWDVHISTGTDHIRDARVSLDQALMQHRHVPKQGKEWTRLKFLCDTWIYMDVVARLTLADDDGESDDVDNIYDGIHPADHTELSLDPFMGLAHSLFLIIGRVATFIRKVRRTNGRSSNLIAQAMDLKSQLEDWTPPPYIETSENERTNPKDSIRAATAYQYATLLYLHQSVPSIPSPSALVLAKRALCELAAVEPSSRSCIIHVYPLMMAGCEMIEEEDRAWVVQRWKLLSSRTKLGIVEKLYTVTKELWARRDAYAERDNILEAKRKYAASLSRPLEPDLNPFIGHKGEDKNVCWFGSISKRRASNSLLSSSTPVAYPFEQHTKEHVSTLSEETEILDPEYTVEGHLHWSGVMQDWNWEGRNLKI